MEQNKVARIREHRADGETFFTIERNDIEEEYEGFSLWREYYLKAKKYETRWFMKDLIDDIVWLKNCHFRIINEVERPIATI